MLVNPPSKECKHFPSQIAICIMRFRISMLSINTPAATRNLVMLFEEKSGSTEEKLTLLSVILCEDKNRRRQVK